MRRARTKKAQLTREQLAEHVRKIDADQQRTWIGVTKQYQVPGQYLRLLHCVRTSYGLDGEDVDMARIRQVISQ